MRAHLVEVLNIVIKPRFEQMRHLPTINNLTVSTALGHQIKTEKCATLNFYFFHFFLSSFLVPLYIYIYFNFFVTFYKPLYKCFFFFLQILPNFFFFFSLIKFFKFLLLMRHVLHRRVAEVHLGLLHERHLCRCRYCLLVGDLDE